MCIRDRSIVDNAAGSDLFICEGMYGEKDKEAKAREYKHMTFYEAADIARKAEVKEMFCRGEIVLIEGTDLFPDNVAYRMTSEHPF